MNKLIGFGASTMQGVGDSQGGFFKRLEKKLAQAGAPHECLNYGIGGDSTRDMLARFDEVKAQLPCRAVVLLGSNDIPRNGDAFPQNRTTLDEYRKNVKIILSAFAGPQTVFVSSLLICQKRTGMDPEVFAKYMGEALKIARSLDMKVWDLYAKSLTWGDKYFVEDGVHYGDVGHEMIAEQVAAMMQDSE
jgi:lysophospholipase L1-like esterase